MKNIFKEDDIGIGPSKKIKKYIFEDISMITKTLEFHNEILKKYPDLLTDYFFRKIIKK